MDFLIDFLGQILVWLKDLLLWLPRKITELVLDGLAFVIEAIPVPDFLQNASGYLAAVPPEVVFFLDGFLFAQGIAIIVSAFVLRFVIRRIPIVG